MINFNTAISRRKRYLNLGSLICIYILALLSFYPPIRTLSAYNWIWVFCVVGWFVFSFLGSLRYFLKPSIYMLAVCLYVVYTVFFAYLSGNYTIGNRFIELSQIFVFYLAYEKSRLYGRSKDSLAVVLCLVPFLLLTLVLTLKEYSCSGQVFPDSCLSLSSAACGDIPLFA